MALGLVFCLISGGGRQQWFYHCCRQNCDPFFVLFFLFHVFLLFHPWGEEKKKGGAGTSYLLVAIPDPPDIYLPSPVMIGVLDVAGRQERFSAETYTTPKYQCWKKEDFSKASPIIWLNWSYMRPVFCRVRVVYFGVSTRIASQPNIITETPTSLIRYTARRSTCAKETRCIATTTFV